MAKKKTVKKTPARKKTAAPARKKAAPRSKKSMATRITDEATRIHAIVKRGRKPTMQFPIRSLSNVKYDPKHGYFELLGRKAERTLTVNTVKTFAQSVRMMGVSHDIVRRDDIASKREVYYVSKSWDECRFKEQPESDTVMDDLEAMFGVNREQMGFFPEERGGDVAGQLSVGDRDRTTGAALQIDCTKLGSGAYSIPSRVEHLTFTTKAKFILVVETKALFERLNHHAYWRKANCIIINMSGVPTRACRRFIRRLADARKLPVYVFTDGDPYGYGNIYRTLKVGSGNAAHINEYFCVPQARFLGVTPDDIEEFDLHDATHPLEEVDIKRARAGLKNDPFIKHHKPWQKALQKMIQMGVRIEQQAFAKHHLNYVIDTYLPTKLKRPDKFLP